MVECFEDEPTGVLPFRSAASSEPSADQVSEALILQARQLINLASVLRSDAANTDDKLPDLFRSIAPSLGTFFQEDRRAEPDTRGLAKNAYRARRLRETIFNELDLFGEPAWDMLLDLMVAHEAGARISVSSACVGACAPPTTGLRWLSILEGRGLVEREDDLLDGRRTYIRLTRKGLSKMEQYLRASRGI